MPSLKTLLTLIPVPVKLLAPLYECFSGPFLFLFDHRSFAFGGRVGWECRRCYYLPNSHLPQPYWAWFLWHCWKALPHIICSAEASGSGTVGLSSSSGGLFFVGPFFCSRVGSRFWVVLVSRNVCHGSSRGKWEVALCWGHGARAVPTQAGVAFPAPLLLIHRGSSTLLLGKSLFWPSWKELASEEGNVPGNGRQMFRFQRGRVEFRRKSLTYAYYLMYIRKKSVTWLTVGKREKRNGNILGERSFPLLAPEEQRQLVFVVSFLVFKAWAFLGY